MNEKNKLPIKKIFNRAILFIFSFILFTLIIFPLSDLSDKITSFVSEMTHNQVYFQFENMNLKLWPFGVAMDPVKVKTEGFGSISTDSLSISPSISSLLTQSPAGKVRAEGLFNGNLEISVSSASKSDKGNERKKIEISAEKINLQDLQDLQLIPLALHGKLDLKTNVLADLTFQDQPDADIVISADKFELPAQTINTMMGPFNLPRLKMGQVRIKGKLTSGRMTIEEGRIGSDSEDMSGTITGSLSLMIQQAGGFTPQMGNYSLDINLKLKSNLEEKISSFLLPIDQYRVKSGDASQFKFRISGMNFNAPPSFSNLR